MHRFTRPDRRPLVSLASALAVGTAIASTPSAALAQERSRERPAEPGAPFSWIVDGLTVAATQFGLVALRLFADIEYGDVEPLPGTGAVLISDLSAAIPVPYAPPRACTVTVGTYEGRQSTLALLTGFLGRQSLRLEDVRVPLDCLPPEARALAQVAGLTEIAVNELRLSTTYDLPTAEAEVSLNLSVRDVADIELRGELDYAFVRLDFTGDEQDPFGEDEPEPVPVVEFGPIDLVLTDRGLGARALPFLRMAGLTSGDVPAIAADGVRGALGPLAIADDLERELTRFVNEGGRLAIALRPGELWLDELEGATPPEIVDAFNPTVGRTTRPGLPDPELLAALRAGELSFAQRLAAGRAFLEGDGMPRNPVRALTLVEPILEESGAAQVIAAEALLASGGDAGRAYLLALRAGTKPEPSGTVLRRAEALVPPARVAELQAEARRDWAERDTYERGIDEAVENGSTLTLVEAARDLESGEGAPRNYGRALELALLGEAAGEIGARPIVDRLLARMTASDEAREAWAEEIQRARFRATRRWLDDGLAATLGGTSAAPTGGPSDPLEGSFGD